MKVTIFQEIDKAKLSNIKYQNILLQKDMNTAIMVSDKEKLQDFRKLKLFKGLQ